MAKDLKSSQVPGQSPSESPEDGPLPPSQADMEAKYRKMVEVLEFFNQSEVG